MDRLDLLEIRILLMFCILVSLLAVITFSDLEPNIFFSRFYGAGGFFLCALLIGSALREGKDNLVFLKR